MKKWKILFLVLVSFTLIAGCTDPKILERLSLTTLLGYDVGEGEEQIESTVIVRQISQDFQSNIETISATAKTSKGTREKISLQAAKKVATGQLRIVLFSEKLSKAGIGQFIYNLLMNPEISNNVYLSVVEGDTKPFLEYKYENISDISQHIFTLLEHNIEREKSLSSTLHEIGRDYYSSTREIVLPIIKRKENLVEITGIALFRDEQMVGRLPAEDVFYVKMLREGFNKGIFELVLDGKNLESGAKGEIPDEVLIAFDSIKSKKTMKLVNPTTPEFNLTIDIKLRMSEIDDAIQIGQKKTKELLQEEINKKLKSELEKIIQYSQELNADVFGFGEYYESQVRDANVTHEEQDKMYPTMKVNIHVNSTIIRSGVFGGG